MFRERYYEVLTTALIISVWKKCSGVRNERDGKHIELKGKLKEFEKKMGRFKGSLYLTEGEDFR